MSTTTNVPKSNHLLDAVVVGAGFSGLYMLHKLRELGFSCRGFEAGSGVGGTWFWNCYPGARCDIESIEYSYSFSRELEQEWDWSERFAAQPEILRYANHVAERFGLLEAIQFDTRVVSAVWDAGEAAWTVTTDRAEVVKARFCILATGCLSTAKLPEIPGLERFAGEGYHTGRWPREGVDFSGKRVGVFGTGSSGIQTITEVAREAASLVVFQRTPSYSLPAMNRPLDAGELRELKQDYPSLRKAQREAIQGIARNPVPTSKAFAVTAQEREQAYERHWKAGRNSIVRAFTDLMVDATANDTASEFVRGKIRSIVRDPATAEALAPRHYLGTKRVCLDTGYYETFNRDNVELVDLKATPIEEVTADGVRTTKATYQLDALIYATGYDAVTGAVLAIDIRTREDRTLREKWAHGPRCYLGLMTAGFPNLFIITGPGSPSILSNVIVSIEHHVEMIGETLAYLRANAITTIDAEEEAEDRWVEGVSELAASTLYPLTDSWYMGANVPGKPRAFMPYIGGLSVYHRICREVVEAGYRGFSLGARQESPAAQDA